MHRASRIDNSSTIGIGTDPIFEHRWSRQPTRYVRISRHRYLESRAISQRLVASMFSDRVTSQGLDEENCLISTIPRGIILKCFRGANLKIESLGDCSQVLITYSFHV